ncbi:skin secretory protein xP2 isoform X1 [Drosophila albomicans]|uniref:Skin secretory protein xP2 isoform X1 n=1 Tax=Drosophila albomicans TaxID=7291 RepID=A0A6P8X5V0_DROAB|nr:skin secretory protein xP2 isoform X1 [Drosophila albomicans]
MKLFLVAFAVIAAVAADVSHLPSNEYLPPAQEVQAIEAPSNEYLAPEADYAGEQGSLAADGYRYKTHRRVVLRRHRRDVSHLPSNEYLPPQEEVQTVEAPSNEYLAPEADYAGEQGSLAADGYRYKTHRRVVLRRHRRDVSHLPSNEYLPPQSAAPSAEYLPPVQVAAPAPAPAPVQIVAAPAPAPAPASVEYAAPVEEAAPAHELADDGYRYKTHRRVVIRRNRRDVSHLPSNEYLPPQEVAAQAPSNEYLPPQQAAPAPVEYAPVEEAAPAHELADDGYRYKTHRRVVIRRHRRDVSHLPSNEYLPPQSAAPSAEYLPPVQVAAPAPVQVVAAPAPAPAPVEYAAPVEEAAPAHELADDGYRYKTHRRVVIRRNRRDVSHLPSNEYLPPVQQEAVPTSEYLPPVSNVVDEYSGVEQGNLANDGYRYKTHRRVVLRRHRRDVSHLPSNEYLPPQAAAPSAEYLPPQQVAAPAPIQIAAPAPVQVAAPAPAPVLDVSVPVEEAAPAHELADDGYRYKTQRRVVYRRH